MTAQGLSTWQRNLVALEYANPMLARRLDERPWGTWRTFERTPGGEIAASDGSRTATVREVSRFPSPVRGLQVLPGIGTGDTVDDLLRAGHRVVVVEPEGFLVRWLLDQFDWSEAIRAATLRIHVPNFTTPEFVEVSLLESGAELQGIMESEAHQVGEVASGHPRAQVLRELVLAARLPGELNRRVRGWPSVKQPPALAIAILSPRCLIFDDLARAFEEQGVSTKLLHVTDQPRAWSRTRWLHAARELRDAAPRFIIARNRTLLETANPRERLELQRVLPAPVIRWWWDVPNVTSHLEEWRAPSTPGYAFARGILEKLPPGNRWLPPAARSAFAEVPLDAGRQRQTVILFVGQSRFDPLRSHVDALANNLAGGAGAALAATVNRARSMSEIHDALRAAEPVCAEAIHRLRPALPAHAYYLDYLLAMSVTAAFRLAAIERLVRAGLALVVHGDDGWLRSGAVAAEQYRGLVHPDHLAELYTSVRLNLNLNFMQVSTTVNPRVLDIVAAGGAVLTDSRPELAELFPDPAARPATFERLDDLVDRAADLLRRDSANSRIAATAVVRARHLTRHRAARILLDLGLASA